MTVCCGGGTVGGPSHGGFDCPHVFVCLCLFVMLMALFYILTLGQIFCDQIIFFDDKCFALNLRDDHKILT